MVYIYNSYRADPNRVINLKQILVAKSEIKKSAGVYSDAAESWSEKVGSASSRF